jgi:hypothetical protein
MTTQKQRIRKLVRDTLGAAAGFWLWGTLDAFMAVPILLAIRIVGDHANVVKPVAELIGR